MQVSPCGHQALCRLCFIKNIQQVHNINKYANLPRVEVWSLNIPDNMYDPNIQQKLMNTEQDLIVNIWLRLILTVNVLKLMVFLHCMSLSTYSYQYVKQILKIFVYLLTQTNLVKKSWQYSYLFTQSLENITQKICLLWQMWHINLVVT